MLWEKVMHSTERLDASQVKTNRRVVLSGQSGRRHHITSDRIAHRNPDLSSPRDPTRPEDSYDSNYRPDFATRAFKTGFCDLVITNHPSAFFFTQRIAMQASKRTP